MMATRNTGPSYDLSFTSLKLSKYLFFDKNGIAITEAVILCKNLRRDFIIFLFIDDEIYSKELLVLLFFIPSHYFNSMPGFSGRVITIFYLFAIIFYNILEHWKKCNRVRSKKRKLYS
jgi:hypothetical protein